MTTYSRYYNNVPSGEEWLGDLPEHWQTRRLKSVITNAVNGAWGEDPKGDDNDLICIRVADFDYANLGVSNRNLTTRNIPKKMQETRLLRNGNLLIEKSGGGDIWPVGRVVSYNLEEKAISSNFIARLVQSCEIDSRFLCYVFAAMYTVRINERSIKQTTGIQNLDLYSYLIERFGFPSISEQCAIAAFLDHELNSIDILIGKKRKLIENLEKQRISIISHAVTKGLNPKVKTKQSGVKWIGYVPEHWQIFRLKYLASIQLSNVDKHSVADEPSVLLCNYLDVYKNERITSRLDFMQATATTEQIRRLSIRKNDVILTKDSETPDDIGIPAIVSEDLPGVVCGYHLALVRVKQNVAIGEYIFREIQGNSTKAYYYTEAPGITRYGLGKQALANTPIALPPIKEQEEIIDFINMQTDRIEALLVKIEESINLLDKQRIALISAAVTGKIDVQAHGQA